MPPAASGDVQKGAPYSILASDTICGLSDQDIDVHSLNKTCGTVGLLNGFREMVVAHEYKHQESLNKCIRAVNPRRLPDIEEATGSQDRVADMLNEWHRVADDLDAALTSSQPDRRSTGKVWGWWGGWWYDFTDVLGHDGQNGCRQPENRRKEPTDEEDPDDDGRAGGAGLADPLDGGEGPGG